MGTIVARVLGHIDKLRGGQQPPLGMLPAHQGLHPQQHLTHRVDLRLVVQAQLVSLDGASQIVADVQAVGGSVVFGQAEETLAAAGLVLGVTRRGLRVGDQFVRGFPVPREHAEPDGDADKDLGFF